MEMSRFIGGVKCCVWNGNVLKISKLHLRWFRWLVLEVYIPNIRTTAMTSEREEHIQLVCHIHRQFVDETRISLIKFAQLLLIDSVRMPWWRANGCVVCMLCAMRWFDSGKNCVILVNSLLTFKANKISLRQFAVVTDTHSHMLYGVIFACLEVICGPTLPAGTMCNTTQLG